MNNPELMIDFSDNDETSYLPDYYPYWRILSMLPYYLCYKAIISSLYIYIITMKKR
jgi:hypothetical protein